MILGAEKEEAANGRNSIAWCRQPPGSDLPLSRTDLIALSRFFSY